MALESASKSSGQWVNRILERSDSGKRASFTYGVCTPL